VVAAIVAAAVIAALLLGFAFVYNRLVRDNNRCVYTWADVDALLAQRAAMLPQLAAIVARAFRHERSVLTAVALARRRVERAGRQPSPERAEAERELGDAGGRLVALVEANPELRTAEATRELLDALQDIEDRLARARLVYNRTVQSYEDRRRAVPGVLVARPLGFGPRPYWQAEAIERERAA
jgi:LemA protein